MKGVNESFQTYFTCCRHSIFNQMQLTFCYIPIYVSVGVYDYVTDWQKIWSIIGMILLGLKAGDVRFEHDELFNYGLVHAVTSGAVSLVLMHAMPEQPWFMHTIVEACESRWEWEGDIMLDDNCCRCPERWWVAGCLVKENSKRQSEEVPIH